MATNALLPLDEVVAKIEAGRTLLLAGSEDQLGELPPGRWIGGTSAYFMAEEGGISASDRIFVTDLTDDIADARWRSYTVDQLPQVGREASAQGFTVLIVPGLSPILETFAKDVQTYDEIFNSPLFGWISGVPVASIGKVQAKTFAGSGEAFADRAVALHLTLPPGHLAQMDIVNLFEQGDGPAIEFPHAGFESSGDITIGGQPGSLAAYIADSGIDTKLPLVADYNGAMINVSVQTVDTASGAVRFFAPVFPGIAYHFAKPVPDYIASFNTALANLPGTPITFCCNCILNYLYADLEGKKTGNLRGPISFGEIAYMLLNQTFVYLSIIKES